MVLYPKEGVSEIQKAQMVSADDPNTRVIGVNGDFDFCQTAIKTIFNDLSFNKKLMDTFSVQLSAANSLNWGRLLPQVVYHASAYLDLVKSGAISMGEMADLCIPTGNFGNILAAYYVKVRYCNYFFGLSFFFISTAKVASITAMIFVHIILHPVVLIYDFHIFLTLWDGSLQIWGVFYELKAELSMPALSISQIWLRILWNGKFVTTKLKFTQYSGGVESRSVCKKTL